MANYNAMTNKELQALCKYTEEGKAYLVRSGSQRRRHCYTG